MKRPEVTVAMVGTGWAGTMHARSYQKVCGVNCRLKTVCSLEPDLDKFAEKFGFEGWTNDFKEVLQDPEVQIVDIVTPPVTHLWMVKAAIETGKHVICEKPLTGYFGKGEELPGHTSRQVMLESVHETLKELEQLLAQKDTKLFYAENWLYSPPFVRAVDLIEKKKTSLLAIYAQTGHKGSHAPHAANWKDNGGGTLIRQGTHPVAAALYMKKREMLSKGLPFVIKSVWCDDACITEGWTEEQLKALHTRSVDVEDWAQVVITFGDGTKASVTSGDMFLSQIYNRMEVFGNDAVYRINMTPNNLLEAYWSDDENGKDIEVMEKNDQNVGWQDALVIEDVIRGYVGQIQDFLECVAYDRQPHSDFELAKETLLVIYAAYLSSEQKKVIDMEEWLK